MKIAEGVSITDASLEAGFSTPSHFAAVNKKMFGITA
ncbi:MAG: helix-turn-helix domain-containing protein [Lachnospiraceae bacterium]|nr:helix-turn-helix domain-containing protein [Lachnospiraceae bacterium]